MDTEREIKTHCGNPLNDALKIWAIAGPGPGGAWQRYQIRGHGGTARMAAFEGVSCDIRFQRGNPAEWINGISNEALLAVVRDRLEGFQRGPFACAKNQHALICIMGAMSALMDRTVERQSRGVEGTEQV